VSSSTNLEASGRLTFSFLGTLSGSYVVSVFVNQSSGLQFVSDAPMTFIVLHAQVSTVKSVIRSPFLTLTTAGVFSSIQLFTKDDYSNSAVNVVPALLTARLFAFPRAVPEALLSANVSAVGSSPGLLNITYVHNTAGRFQFEIRYNNIHLHSSPFVVSVLPGTVDPASSFISLGTAQGGVVPIDTTFTIDYADRFGNPASDIGASSPEVIVSSGLQVSINPITRIKYSVRFSVSSHASLFIHVRVNQQHIRGSPFTANYVSSQTVPVLSYRLSGLLAPLPSAVLAGNPLTFCAQARSQEGFDMKVDYVVNRIVARLTSIVRSGSTSFTSFIDLKSLPGSTCTWNVEATIT